MKATKAPTPTFSMLLKIRNKTGLIDGYVEAKVIQSIGRASDLKIYEKSMGVIDLKSVLLLLLFEITSSYLHISSHHFPFITFGYKI